MRFDALSRRQLMPIAYVALLAAALAAQYWRVAAPLDLGLMDRQTRFLREHFPRPAGNDVVVVGIDEAFLDSVREPVALMHPHLAKFLSAMAAAGPSVVGFDVVFPRQSFRFLAPTDVPDTNYDLLLVRAMFQAKSVFPIVLGKTWDISNGSFREILIDYIAAARRRPAPPLSDADADPRASVLVCKDEDAVVRRFPGAWCQPDASEWNLASKMAAYAGNSQTWSGYIDYLLGPPFGYVPMGDALKWFDQGDAAKLASVFRGRPVLVGPILPFEDRHWLPVELAAWEPGNRYLPGVLIHAQALRSIMNTGLLHPVPGFVDYSLAALLTLFWWIRRQWLGVFLFAAVAIALVGASTSLLSHGWVLAVGGALATGLAALAARFGLEAFKIAREKNLLKHSFSGYVSPQVLREILAGRLKPGQSADRLRAVVLFADIHGITRRIESVSSEKLVSVLNRYFSLMAEVVHKHQGTMDKFIGDRLTALFGAPAPLERPEQNALETAQEMLERLGQLNKELAASGEEPLSIGIGIHAGELVVGHVGSQQRQDYTAIGPVVSAAVGLETLSRAADHAIICSEAVAAALGYPKFLVNLGKRTIAEAAEQTVFGWNPAVVQPA